MTPRTATYVSRACIALIVVLAGLAVVASNATPKEPIAAPIIVGDPQIADGPRVLQTIEDSIETGTVRQRGGVGDFLVYLFAIAWIVTGSLIVSRQPRNFAGWLMIASSIGWALATAGPTLVAWSLVAGHDFPLRGFFAVASDEAITPVLLLPLLFLLFPDGKPPTRWRFVEWALLGGLAFWTVGYVLSPGPINALVDNGILYVSPIGIPGLASVADTIAFIGGATIVCATLLCVPAVRGRYKRATGEDREQLRWLVAVATVAGAFLLASILRDALAEAVPSLDSDLASNLLFIGMALAVGIGVPGAYLNAIFRYGLWDLDVVIRKARIALVLTLVLVLPTVAVIALAARVLVLGWAPKGAAVIGGVMIGVLLVPLIAWERRVARRITYGARASQYEVLTTFGAHVGESFAIDDVAPRMVRLLVDATGATSARVLLRVDADVREVATLGSPGDDLHRFPVTDGDEDLGALEVTFSPSDPSDATKEQLLRDLAAQAGLIFRNVRLVEQLRSSRQRLVAAQDEERRKLERNIHDGVQQQLVALAVKLKLADAMVDRDPSKAHETLASLQSDTGTTLDDLRNLARGIYPPLLADQGLTAALDAQARRAAIPTTVTAEGVGRYDQAVEAAVYFCSLEALNNIAKYAQAAHATIALRQRDGHLAFEVSDDGRGFDAATTNYGTGLQGMADRLDAIGAELRVTSEPGHGTVVSGLVPLVPT